MANVIKQNCLRNL